MKLILFLLIGVSVAHAQQARPYFSEPSLSPDRKEIAFVSGGDIWTVPATGGVSALLVSHPATESRPMYSPDGAKLAFVSTRTGNGDIYVLTLASGELKQFEVAYVELTFMGETMTSRVIFGPDNAEPILGVIALESHGLAVDPSSRTLRRLPALPLKEIVLAE